MTRKINSQELHHALRSYYEHIGDDTFTSDSCLEGVLKDIEKDAEENLWEFDLDEIEFTDEYPDEHDDLTDEEMNAMIDEHERKKQKEIESQTRFGTKLRIPKR
jgi:hypothetical protein